VTVLPLCVLLLATLYVYSRCVTKEAVALVDASGLYCSTMLSSARERPVRYVLSNILNTNIASYCLASLLLP
jgi:hypothetical protein